MDSIKNVFTLVLYYEEIQLTIDNWTYIENLFQTLYDQLHLL